MKKVKLISIFLIVLLFFSISFVYAENEQDEIVFAQNSEVDITENIEIILNIEKIEYSNFLVTLESDLDMDQLEETDELEVTKNSDNVQINIDKETTTLNQLTLAYKIPENYNIGDNIVFNISIKNNESEEEIIKVVEIEIVDKKEDNNELNVDKIEDNNELNEIMPSNNNESINDRNINNENNVKEQAQDNFSQNVKMSTQSSFSNVSNERQNAETITYNGSSNNYLSDLYVTGYEFTESFNKENETYFLTVNNDVSSLTTVAVPEEEKSTVKIYGNEEIDVGTNKILVTVTAEDGSVRNYRIYVTRQEGE